MFSFSIGGIGGVEPSADGSKWVRLKKLEEKLDTAGSIYGKTSTSALQIWLGVPDQRLRNGKLIVKSARIGQVAVNEA